MVTPHKLATAYFDNVRHNQIGGQQDGMSPELAADLGYETPERMHEIISTLGTITSPAELKLSVPYTEDDENIPTIDGRRVLPDSAKGAIALAHQQAVSSSKNLLQGAEITARPYVTRALRGLSVDANRRSAKKGR